MHSDSTTSIDFTRELRLRRWARLNYVAIEDRSAEWHAIVLDEMRRRDVELTERISEGTTSGRFVPLPPTDLQRLDKAHDAVAQPNLLNAETRRPDVVVYNYSS